MYTTCGVMVLPSSYAPFPSVTVRSDPTHVSVDVYAHTLAFATGCPSGPVTVPLIAKVFVGGCGVKVIGASAPFSVRSAAPKPQVAVGCAQSIVVLPVFTGVMNRYTVTDTENAPVPSAVTELYGTPQLFGSIGRATTPWQ